MLEFYDDDGDPLRWQPVRMPLSTVGDPIPISFEARDGYELTATGKDGGALPVGVTVEARRVGVTPWTNIGAGPLDVSPYAPGLKDFEIRLTLSGSAVAGDIEFYLAEPAIAPGDTTPPTIPTGLTADALGETSVRLDGFTSTDDVGVTGYEYRRDGSAAQDMGMTKPFDVTGLTLGTFYDFQVRAYDAAGNRSDWSAIVTEQTLGGPLETFSDNFDDNSIDPSKWEVYDWDWIGYPAEDPGVGSITETGGKLNLTPGNEYSPTKAIRTVEDINFVGKTLEFDIEWGDVDPAGFGVAVYRMPYNEEFANIEIYNGYGALQTSPAWMGDYPDHDPAITAWRLNHDDSNNTWRFYSKVGGVWTLLFTSDVESWTPDQCRVEFYVVGNAASSFTPTLIDNVDVS